MASFQGFIPTLSNNEGGYQDIPEDRGNYNSNNDLIGTNHGISAPVLERYLGITPSLFDMKYLSYETAKDIFKKMFWDILKGDQIKDQAVAETIIDHGINSSPSRATKIVQKVLNEYWLKNLVVDGVLGTNTLNAINSVDAKHLFVKYNEAREDYYRSLSQFPIFGKSWLRRIHIISEKFQIFLSTTNSVLLPVALIGVVSVVSYLLIKNNISPQ